MLGSSQFAESGVKVGDRILDRYLLRGEQVNVATRQHWARMVEPVITVVVGFFLAAWLSSGLVETLGGLILFVWFVWFFLIGRVLWKLLEWRQEWFCVTNKRVLSTYGLLTHKVAMMPLAKVTDLSYGRSVGGRMFGYGDLTLESAGQDQALRHIKWIPTPDETYRQICDIIFGEERFDHEDSLQADDPSHQVSDPTSVYPVPRVHRPSRRRLYISKKGAAGREGGRPDAPYNEWPD
jgi:hypothetical protein